MRRPFFCTNIMLYKTVLIKNFIFILKSIEFYVIIYTVTFTVNCIFLLKHFNFDRGKEIVEKQRKLLKEKITYIKVRRGM